jgi:hypothetical protein
MNTHHAVLVSSNAPLLFEPEVTLSVIPSARYVLQQITIGDVRQLIADAHRRPAGEAVEQVLYVATEFITEEAQQALLKIIEEPPLSTRFIFVIPIGYTVLPTLESRFQRINPTEVQKDTTAFDEFVYASYADRLATIEKASKDKNVSWMAAIKYGLLQYLLKGRYDGKGEQLSDMEMVLRLLLTRGASNKFLLEQLALTLPSSG